MYAVYIVTVDLEPIPSVGAWISAVVDLRHRKTVNSAIESGGFCYNSAVAEKPVNHGRNHRQKF